MRIAVEEAERKATQNFHVEFRSIRRITVAMKGKAKEG